MAIWKIMSGITSDKTLRTVRLRSEKIEGGRLPSCFYPGDMVETDKDLSKHNHGGHPRYERQPDEPLDDILSGTNLQEDASEREELSAMTVVDLRNRAEELGIDLTDANKKQEIIDTILAVTEAI